LEFFFDVVRASATYGARLFALYGLAPTGIPSAGLGCLGITGAGTDIILALRSENLSHRKISPCP
jgi:hypothetical protein